MSFIGRLIPFFRVNWLKMEIYLFLDFFWIYFYQHYIIAQVLSFTMSENPLPEKKKFSTSDFEFGEVLGEGAYGAVSFMFSIYLI